jgi:hypothetical protein
MYGLAGCQPDQRVAPGGGTAGTGPGAGGTRYDGRTGCTSNTIPIITVRTG